MVIPCSLKVVLLTESMGVDDEATPGTEFMYRELISNQRASTTTKYQKAVFFFKEVCFLPRLEDVLGVAIKVRGRLFILMLSLSLPSGREFIKSESRQDRASRHQYR